MDFGKFPKQRSIPTSGEGERQARMLDMIGTPALHRRNLDGSVSRKVGDRLYVEPAQKQEVESLYTAGTLSTGVTGTFSSPDPRKAFKRIGKLPFVADGSTSFEDLGFITSNSDGSGFVADNENAGYTRDFDYDTANSSGVGVFTMAYIVNGTAYRTRNGKTVNTDFSGYSCRAIPEAMSGSILDSMRPMPGQYVIKGGARVPLRGASMITLESVSGVSGHYWTRFVGINADATAQFGDTLGLPYTMAAGHQMLVLGPGRYMLATRCIRSVRRPTLASNASNPLMIAQYSLDAGQSWAQVASTAALDAEIATVQAIPLQAADNASNTSRDTYARYFNDASFYTRFSEAAPIKATKALALVKVSYNDYANSGGTIIADQPLIGEIRARIKIVEIDTSAGCAITAKQTIFDGRLLEAAACSGDIALPTGDGMLFALRDVEANAADEDAWQGAPDRPLKVWFTSNGTDLRFIASMPFPAYCTGVPIYIDADTIACPMYVDGAHWLYLSRDRMATWVRGALITRSGIPPAVSTTDPVSGATMRNFGRVARLRSGNGAATNLHPQAPWIMDCQFTAPT